MSRIAVRLAKLERAARSGDEMVPVLGFWMTRDAVREMLRRVLAARTILPAVRAPDATERPKA
ncbi:MAG: hypothetical protein J0L85_07390 [Zoogloea sp.]|nr:hypothetical protein [Zoogloea sp.]MCA0187490.1 hypothetical protein [Pseudomonadota bacterium]